MFYENLERIAKMRGLKPGPACVKAGLTQGRAANWKQTGALPKEFELGKLAMALGCHVHDFFMDNESTPFRNPEEAEEYWAWLDSINPMKSDATSDLSEDEQYLLRIYRAGDRRQRALFMVEAYSFADEHGISYED